MTTNYERIKNMTIDLLAQTIVFDSEGNMHSPCGICFYEDNCIDECYKGIKQWLKSEVNQ